ncbi:MAG: hypothetical protein V7641_3817 [Blastocatellia bacterium]
MVLALAGGSVFAATTQNKNAKPAAAAKTGGMKKKHKRAHRRGAKKAANKNM